jgi:hypothetical protein
MMGKWPKREVVNNGNEAKGERRDNNIKMSAVEATYVVESHMFKNHYHRSLAKFWIKTVLVLSFLKSISSFLQPSLLFFSSTC